jgi:hypothetical protein
LIAMDVVLDIDLDFFVWPISHCLTGKARLRDDECTHLASRTEVRHFLEQRCHLTTRTKLLGQEFVEHEDAFRAWRRWLNGGKMSAPFIVVHVDAHADLGAGLNSTPARISELLKWPLQDRSQPVFCEDGINSSNYLAFAIANRWISCLTYVYPTDPAPQVQGREAMRVAELREFLGGHDGTQPPVRDLPAWCFSGSGDDWWKDPIKLGPNEPDVRLELKAVEQFEFSEFTHVVVAQSPAYTPTAADGLLPVIRDYFRST